MQSGQLAPRQSNTPASDRARYIAALAAKGYREKGCTVSNAMEFAPGILCLSFTDQSGKGHVVLFYDRSVIELNDAAVLQSDSSSNNKAHIDDYYFVATGIDTKEVTTFETVQRHVEPWFSRCDNAEVEWFTKPLPFIPKENVATAPTLIMKVASIPTNGTAKQEDSPPTEIESIMFENFLDKHTSDIGMIRRLSIKRAAKKAAGTLGKLSVDFAKSLLPDGMKPQFAVYCRGLRANDLFL